MWPGPPTRARSRLVDRLIVKPSATRSRALLALKVAVAILLLFGTLRVLDAKLPLHALAKIKPRWLVAGIATGTLAQLASALRWRFTASRMGAPISMRFAIVECYVASLLNQILLFGIGGDALRITRHGASLNRGATGYGLALRTHVVERVAGQLVLATFACLAAMAWAPSIPATLAIAGVAIVAGLLAAFIWRHRAKSTRSRLVRWLDEAHSALFAKNAWHIQLGLSGVIIVGCLLTYFCAALALDVQLSLREVLRIGPLVLTAMALPLSIGGFGPREAASAALFSASALDPGRGTLVALVYGVLSLLATLPAIPFWLLRKAPSAGGAR